jgi:hypothetical protein
MTKPVKDFAASARARLLDVTHARHGNFQLALHRSEIDGGVKDSGTVGERIRAFLDLPVRAVSNAEGFDLTWPAGGPWQGGSVKVEG